MSNPAKPAIKANRIGAARGQSSIDIDAPLVFTNPADALTFLNNLLVSLNYQGTWNATTNTPTIPAAASGNKYEYYKVAVAGTTTIDGNSVWNVGDWLVSNGTAWVRSDAPPIVSFPISPDQGGTGINNSSYTITLGGDVSFSGPVTFGDAVTIQGELSVTGVFPLDFIITNATSLTLPNGPGTVLVDSGAVPMAGAFDLGGNIIFNTSELAGLNNGGGIFVHGTDGVGSHGGGVNVSGGGTDISTAGAVQINGGTATGSTGIGGSVTIHGGNSTNVSFGTGGSVTIATGTGATANGTLTLTSGNIVINGHSFSLGGNFSTAGAVSFAGAFASTFTFTAATSVTFPTSGTLAILGANTFIANQTISDGFNLTLGVLHGSAGSNLHGGLYFSGTAATGNDWLMGGNNFAVNDFGWYYGTSFGANPGNPVFYMIGSSNRTTIGHSAASQPTGTSTLNVEGSLAVTGLTAFCPVFGGTTTANPLQSGAIGASGQVMVSNGTGAIGSYQTLSLSSGSTFSGTLPVARGGTGVSNSGGGITFFAAITFSGSNPITIGTTATTSVTLPTSGILVNQAGINPSTTGLVDYGPTTLTCNAANVEQFNTWTIAAARTLVMSGVTAGMRGVILITQDATGGRTVTLPSAFTNHVINGGAGALTLSVTGGVTDMVTWWTPDGTNMYWTVGLHFS